MYRKRNSGWALMRAVQDTNGMNKFRNGDDRVCM